MFYGSFGEIYRYIRCSSLIYDRNTVHDICDLPLKLHGRHHGSGENTLNDAVSTWTEYFFQMMNPALP